MRSIGLDIGTTTISAVVFDDDKIELVKSRTVDNEFFISSGKEWEKLQDADGIVRKTREVLDELLEEFGDVEAIGLTGQMHGIVYTDENGDAVSSLFTWQDGRGNLDSGAKKPLYRGLKSRPAGTSPRDTASLPISGILETTRYLQGRQSSPRSEITSG